MSQIDFRLIRQLWSFLAVAEESHFGRAAARLGISQPPLTEQIKVLEQSLGLTLFDRSRKGTRLSASGRALLPAIQRFAEQVQHLERTVREVAKGQSGVYRLGAITSAMLETVPDFLAEMRLRYPRLTVSIREIDSVEAIPLLASKEIDFAFLRLDGPAISGIGTHPLTQDQLAVALPANHPLAELPSNRIISLASEDLVFSSRRVSPLYFDRLVATCHEYGFTPRIMHEVRSVASQIAYVSCGQGVALVPYSMKQLAPEGVVVRPLTEPVNVVTAAAAWLNDHDNPLVAAAVDVLKNSERHQ
ncbi:LysR family transcriptional regulator [Aquidulcibacter paucihalophilus]|uniref:LysR family transcriptional regulator n=1 Tax=Aquidulcibacter paucihalophilus TaxID=1978549 RepID=UPI000A1930D2|nr:LysR family transcriptional regulator [Aquidulcibacter paucihalophilus]